MPNSYLLVPGTGGITLMDNQGNDLGYPVKMRLGVTLGGLLGYLAPADLVELLSMDHRPGQIAPAKTSLKQGVSIRPGHLLLVAYNQVPTSFNQFLYDWRADLRYSARQLLDYLRDRRPSGGRWNIIAHSQGGLLVVLASKLLPNASAFAELVSSVVLVGAPLAGTVNAAHALLLGDQMGPTAEIAFQQILRTWPSLYQMLPSWDAVFDAPGQPAEPDAQLLSIGAWTGYEGISADLIQRARDVQPLLRDPLAAIDGDVQVTLLMANDRATSLDLRRVGGRLTADSITTETGDTLVPYRQTCSTIGSLAFQNTATLEGVNEHSMLFDDPTVMGRVRARLRA